MKCLIKAIAVSLAGLLALPASAVSAETVLTVAAVKTPNGIDHDYHVTHEDHVIRASVYDKLLSVGMRPSQDGLTLPSYDRADLRGRLAESWSLSEDGKTLTIKLREGVMSHAGNELTAEDVQWTWDRSWALDAVGAFYAKAILDLTEPTWRTTGRYTWEISTPEYNSLLELLMMNNDLDIFDAAEAKKHVTEEDPWAVEWLATNSAGFGPYQVTQWTPGERVVLEAFNDYHRGKPAIDRIVYREVPEPANRYALVTSGGVDIAENLPPRFLKQADGIDALKLWQATGNRIFRFDVNHQDDLTGDARVRKALYHAVPLDELISSVFFDFAQTAKSPVPSTFPGYTAEAWDYGYDLERAKALVEEAGAAGSEIVINFDAGTSIQETTAIILKASFEAIGLDIRLNKMSSAAYSSRLYSREFQSFFQTAFPILPDPGYALALTYKCNAFLNTNAYCNEDIDARLDDAIATRDEAERLAKYDEIQNIMIGEDAVQLWIAEPGWQLVTTNRVAGLAWNTANVYPFYDVKLE